MTLRDNTHQPSDIRLYKVLQHIEILGNRLPLPTILFIYLAFFVLILSAFASFMGLSATHPVTGDHVAAINLLSEKGLHRILMNTVTNFTHFAPVGTVLVAILGISIAEHSGLLNTLLRVSIANAPKHAVTAIIVFAGVMSSLAADAGYVVLLPLAGMIYKSLGRNPLAGIAAAFAGVSGGFSANLIIGPFEVIIAGISTEAARIADTTYTVNPAGNYYFLMVSTLLITLIATLVTEKVTCKRLMSSAENKTDTQDIIPQKDMNALKYVGVFTIAFIVLLLIGSAPENGWLRDPETHSLIKSPFMSGIVTVMAVYFAIAGYIYGKISGRFHSLSDCIEGMEKHISLMASYLVLMFFAAQFVAYFSWSHLGIILAILGADLLAQLDISLFILLPSFVLFSALINLFIGSASAKWALMAPIFIPMFLLAGISPEGAQIAYRIGDSTTNIITPLMPYFGVVIAFVQQHDKKAGIGTVIAMMLPYSVALLIGWLMLLIIWLSVDLPLGPGAYFSLT